MNLPPGFAERLAEKTDEQLCEMFVQAGVYLPEALEAARAELHRRKLTPERVAEIEAAVQVKLAERHRLEEESFRGAHVVSSLIHFLVAVLAAAIAAVGRVAGK